MTNGYRVRTQSRRWARVFAVLAAVGLIATACGSGDAQASGEVSIGPSAPTEEDGLQYGESIEDWSEELEAEAQAAEASRVVNDYPEGFEEIGWDDLIPAGFSHQEIFARYEDRLNALDEGSAEAETIYNEMQAEYNSTDSVNREMDGSKINLAGFVAPLNYDDDIITEFLLVPYFGACIHAPAPPGNQTVLVTLDKSDGLSIEDTWGAIWVAGTITVDSAVTDLANASYTIVDATSGVYDEYS